MSAPLAGWHDVCEKARRFMRGPTWRRRLAVALLVVAAQGAALGVTYRAVIFHHRTLMTGAVLPGTEGIAPPYGYPGLPVQGWNEVDAAAAPFQFVPQIRKAHSELVAGHLPLWSANVMLGAPLIAGDQLGLYNPLTWPLLARPTTGVWDAWLLSRLLLAGLLAAALAAYLGLWPVPATLAGLVYMLSGVFELRTTTIQTSVMALLPLLIITVEYCVRTASWRSAAALAGAVAATILFGMPEEDFLCLAMAGVYFFVRWFAGWTSRGGAKPSLRVLYAGSGAAVVGALGGLPQLLPFAEYLGLGMTSHTTAAHNALMVEDPSSLVSLVGPHWSGPGVSYPLRYAPFDNWFGVGAIYLALLGVFSQSLPRGVRTLLVVIAVGVEAKVVGIPDWFNQFVGNLPVISRITFWEFSGVFVALAVALLAGAGLQRLQFGIVRKRQIAATCAVLAIAIGVGMLAFLKGHPVVVSAVALTAATLAVVVDGALTAVRPSRRARVVGLVMVGGGTVLELVLLATPGVALPVRYDPLAPTPTTAYLQRVMPTGSGRSYSATAILYPTTNQAFNIDDVRNLDGIYVERTYRYLKDFVVPGLFDRFDGIQPDIAHYIQNPFFDALNVKYVLVAPSASPPPTDQFALATVAADGVAIYSNRDAAPRAQVFFDTTTASSEKNADALMHRPGFDPTRSAVVEGAALSGAGPTAPAPASVVSYADSRVVMTTATTRPGILVLADAYYPGWTAELDGKPVPIEAVDVAFRGVAVPAGTHTVAMSYQPASVVFGALGVPVGVTLFVVGAFAPPLVARIRRTRRST